MSAAASRARARARRSCGEAAVVGEGRGNPRRVSGLL